MSDVQHQPRAMRAIQRALQSRRMPHAYLFTGPEGVGREMMALGLAQTLLCEAPGPMISDLRSVSSDPQPPLPIESEIGNRKSEIRCDACGTCKDCQLVQADTHPDLAIIYRQLNRQHPESTIRKQKALNLSVDVIRHFLVDKAGTRPSRGRAHVFIVREAERMNDAAQNALLKTLEEPPESTFLILISTGPDRMLPTIRSRCQQVRFQLLPAEFVVERLRSLRPDAPEAERDYVARHTGGSLGAAIRQIDDGLYPLKRTWGEQLMELATRCGTGVPPARSGAFAPHSLGKPMQVDAQTLGKALAARDPEISDTDATRGGLQMLLSVLADFYSDALRTAVGAASGAAGPASPDTPGAAPGAIGAASRRDPSAGAPPHRDSRFPLINADQPDVIHRLVATRRPGSLTAALRAIAQAEANLARNANIELTLEALFIQLAASARRVSAGVPA